MSIKYPTLHTEFHQAGLQIFEVCGDKCINFHNLKPRCKHILTNTILFCPFDRLCVESACFLQTCGFSQPNVNVGLPW